jgi:hypothetical protein
VFNFHDNFFIVLDFAVVVAAFYQNIELGCTALAASYIVDPLNLWLERNMLPATWSNVVQRHLEYYFQLGTATLRLIV